VLAGRPLDVTVAAQPLRAGDVALSVPEKLVVTLDRIFESEGLAEMLTAGKLSELACLALYMMYEKKVRGVLWLLTHAWIAAVPATGACRQC
jgi:histone-lysine N-methyltransferase SETD3